MEASEHTGAFPAADGLPWGVCKGELSLPAHKMGLIQIPQNKFPRTEHASWKVPSGSCSKSEEGSAYF